MARARNIKPGFFTNEDLVELPFETRLLFIGLWTIADRAGRLYDRPKTIKMALFPADTVNIDEMLTGLAARGFIWRYEVDGVKCIQIITWEKHQNPHMKEAVSSIPAPVERRTETEQAPTEHGASTVRAVFLPEPARLIPDSLNLIADSGYQIPDTPKKVKSTVPPSGETAVVFAYWQRIMNHPQSKIDAKRDKAIKARLKDGYTVEQLCKAVDGCKLSPHHMGQNDSRTVYDDIELICRDGPHVDKFISWVNRGAGNGMSPKLAQQVDILQTWLEKQED